MAGVGLSRVIAVGEVANTDFLHRTTFDTLVRLGAFREGPSRTRLLAAGLDLAKVDSLNLCSPGRWDPSEAVENARSLMSALLVSGKTHDVLIFGRRACMAFGLHYEPGRVKTVDGVILHSLPHPSGVNRFWNTGFNLAWFNSYIREVMTNGSA